VDPVSAIPLEFPKLCGVTEHRYLDLDGARIFYREAGKPDSPVVLLPHGYPCSSYEFRDLLTALADRWRVIAPDFPGCGYSDTPSDFEYTFDGYARFLDRFTEQLRIDRLAIYLHDFGSQIGLRFAIQRPEKISALIIQNGDIYEDELGPKYAGLQEYFRNPTPAGRAKLAEAVSEEGYREEFLNDLHGPLAERISPDLWKLHWSLTTPERREIYVDDRRPA
jgi:pimeloyl-ACP methyl ester carboxylesterase